MIKNYIKPLSFFGLIMLITGAIDSVRNMPAVALFGPQLVFFFVFAALVFLIPVALIAAELSSTFSERSGIYAWTEYAFGAKVGFFAIWLQWANTVIWYPTILSFIAGTLAYLINPALAQNKLFLIGVILSVLWMMTLINLRGIKTSAHFASFSAVIGLFIPVLLMILLALIWIFYGNPSQLHFTSTNIFPTFSHSESWISLTAIVTSFLGIELACVHVNKVDNPKQTFPKALGLATILILVTMISGSLAIAIVISSSKINLITGVMETFKLFFSTYHLSWLTSLLAIMIMIGSMGELINWIISPAKRSEER